MVIKKSAIVHLQKVDRAKLELPGPIKLTGVGEQKFTCKHGAYSVRLPLKNGREAVLSGLCLKKKVTATFPIYPLKRVMRDFNEMCQEQGGDVLSKTSPNLPKNVGEETDILIGIKVFPRANPHVTYRPRNVQVCVFEFRRLKRRCCWSPS